jgi:hypothetical protein
VDRLAYRVVTRFFQARAIADPKTELHKFQILVDNFCGDEKWAKEDVEKIKKLRVALERDDERVSRRLADDLKKTSTERFMLGSDARGNYQRTKGTAQGLFWSILQQYQLPPKIRRGIEKAARFWSRAKLPKRRIKSQRGTYDADAEKLENYLEVCVGVRQQVTDAQSAIVKGKLFSDPEVAAETKIEAGSFTLINTGGFKDEVMAKAAQVVKKAEKAMRGIGQGKVCYGDILVSKTINNKRTVAAFYVDRSDEMFVRANVPTDWDTVRVVCHELTHRLIDKFLQGKRRGILDIYATLNTQQRFMRRDLIPEEYLPKRGEELVEKGETWKIKDVDPWRQSVKFTKGGDPKSLYSTSILFWLKMKGVEVHQIPDFKGFISKYAATNPEENFCEMVSFYAIGKLPASQVELLKEVL